VRRLTRRRYTRKRNPGIQPAQNIVNYPLKSLLCGVAQSETHDGEFEKAERCCDGCLVYVFRRDRYLVISTDEVELREDGLLAGDVGREIVQVRKRV